MCIRRIVIDGIYGRSKCVNGRNHYSLMKSRKLFITVLVWGILSIFFFGKGYAQSLMPAKFISGIKLQNTRNIRELSEVTFELAKELVVDYVLVPVKYPARGKANVNVDNLDWAQGLDYYHIFELAEKYNILVLPAFYKLGGREDRDFNKYADFVICFLDKFYDGKNIQYIEFQNEPVKDYNGRVSARYKGTPADLAKTTTAAYTAVKAKYPRIQIGTPGFMSAAVTDSENEMINEYYKEYFSAKPKFDVLTLHHYPKTSSYLEKTPYFKKGYNFLSESEIFQAYRKLLNDFGYSDKPIFVTEGDVGMPFKNPGGQLVKDWFDQTDAIVMLIERFVLTLSSSKDKNIIGSMISDIESQGNTALFRYDIETGSYSITEMFKGYKILLGFLKDYPDYSSHLSGKIDSTDYWVEEFKNRDGRRLWIAFCPFLFRAEAESPQRLRAVAVDKAIDYPQEVSLKAANTASVKLTSISETKILPVNNGIVRFTLGKEPVFIEEYFFALE